MCDPTTLVTSLAGMAFSALTAPDKPKMPNAPPPVAAPPKTQASKAPSVDAMRQQNAARGAGSGYTGNASTLLTGSAGVADDELKLGKNTALGA